MQTSQNAELRAQLDHYGQQAGIWAAVLTVPFWMLVGVAVAIFRNFVGGNPKTVSALVPVSCLVAGFALAALVSALCLWHGQTGREIKATVDQLSAADKGNVAGQAAVSAVSAGFIGISVAAGIIMWVSFYLFLLVLMCLLPFLLLLL